jgi:hypothetical protein
MKSRILRSSRRWLLTRNTDVTTAARKPRKPRISAILVGCRVNGVVKSPNAKQKRRMIQNRATTASSGLREFSSRPNVADRGGCREDPGSCKEAILAVTVSKSEKAKPKEIKVKGQ